MIDIQNTIVFNKFKVKLNELYYRDKTVIAMYKKYCSVNNFTRIDVAEQSDISISTIRRIEQTSTFGSAEVKDKLAQVLGFNMIIDENKITILENLIQYFLTYSYYGCIEEENEYYQKICDFAYHFENTPVELFIELLTIIHKGIFAEEAKRYIRLLERVKYLYPLWLEKLINRVILTCHAVRKDEASVYRYVEIIESNSDKDIWDSYAKAAFPMAMDYIGDLCSELYYLQNTLDLNDLSQIRNKTHNYLKMSKIFLRQGNLYQAKKLINQSKTIVITTNHIENMRNQVLAYLHFIEKQYEKIIECLADLKNIDDECYTSYIIKVYSYYMLERLDDYESTKQYLIELLKDKQEIILIELLELVLRDGNLKKIKSLYRELQKIELIHNKMGYFVIVKLINEKLN